jgi:hypothetical protein
MAFPIIEASFSFGGLEHTLTGTLQRLTHVRGWGYPCSYVIIEVFNPQTEIINEFMNYGIVTIKYGKDGEYVGPFEMEITSVENEIEFSLIKLKVTAVEPGFLRMTETTRCRSYPNQTVADCVGTLAHEAGLQTIGIKQTSGTYTYIQSNLTDLQFMSKHLFPIATDSGFNAPYLWTIDNNIMHLRPPALEKKPLFSFILDPSNETVVKRFDVMNVGLAADFTYGNSYTTYGYTSTGGGLHQCTNKPEQANPVRLNKQPYQSNFNRTEVLPYEEPWMTEAHNRNNISRAGFIVGAETVTVGEVELFFDEMLQFTAESFGKQPTEYSGKYYVYNIRNTLETRLFLSEMHLVTNSFLKAETTKAPGRSRPSNRPNLRPTDIQNVNVGDLSRAGE